MKIIFVVFWTMVLLVALVYRDNVATIGALLAITFIVFQKA